MKNRFDELLVPGGALQSRLFARLVSARAAAGEPADMLPGGTRIGPYEILDTLGEGGSAQVYLAARADGQFEQTVAIKLVRGVGERLERAFRRERQILAGLNHPGVARLFDGGCFHDGRLWFAMEHVVGERIDDFVREHRLDWKSRVALIDQVAEALDYAHARGLVHRDIKPANILVDEHGRTKLLDFGIALAPKRGGVTGELGALTPEWASPEQLAGGAVTPASDLYQLGRLLAIVLRGEVDFCPTMPAPPPGEVGAALRAIVAKCCAENVSDRYPSVASLRTAIAQLDAMGGPGAASVLRGLRDRVAASPLAWLSIAAAAGLAIGAASMLALR